MNFELIDTTEKMLNRERIGVIKNFYLAVVDLNHFNIFELPDRLNLPRNSKTINVKKCSLESIEILKSCTDNIIFIASGTEGKIFDCLQIICNRTYNAKMDEATHQIGLLAEWINKSYEQKAKETLSEIREFGKGGVFSKKEQTNEQIKKLTAELEFKDKLIDSQKHQLQKAANENNELEIEIENLAEKVKIKEAINEELSELNKTTPKSLTNRIRYKFFT